MEVQTHYHPPVVQRTILIWSTSTANTSSLDTYLYCGATTRSLLYLLRGQVTTSRSHQMTGRRATFDMDAYRSVSQDGTRRSRKSSKSQYSIHAQCALRLHEDAGCSMGILYLIRLCRRNSSQCVHQRIPIANSLTCATLLRHAIRTTSRTRASRCASSNIIRLAGQSCSS